MRVDGFVFTVKTENFSSGIVRWAFPSLPEVSRLADQDRPQTRLNRQILSSQRARLGEWVYDLGDWGTVASDALIWEMGKVKVKDGEELFSAVFDSSNEFSLSEIRNYWQLTSISNNICHWPLFLWSLNRQTKSTRRIITSTKTEKYKCWRKKFARVRKQQYIVQITEQRAILKHDFWNMILISKPQNYKTSSQIHPWLCFMTPSPSLSGFPYLQIKKRSKVLWKLQQQKNERDKF